MNDLAPGARAGQLIFFLHTVEERLEAALEPLGLSVAKFGVLAKLVAAGGPPPPGTRPDSTARVRAHTAPPIARPAAPKPRTRVADTPERRSNYPRRAEE